jgi:hypothetical protein
MLEPHIIEGVLADIDVLGWIAAGATIESYNPIATTISKALFADVTLTQVQTIIWNAIYGELCICSVGGDKNIPWVMDKRDAVAILGTPARYKNLAAVLRDLFRY